jgi:hypothetical protein
MFTLLINGKPVPGVGDLPVSRTKITVTWGNHGQGQRGGLLPNTGTPDDPMDRDTVRRNFESIPDPRGGGAASAGKGGTGSTA